MTLLEEQGPAGASTEPLSPEEILERDEGHRYELINGNLVERHMGARSSLVASRVIHILSSHADTHKAGKVFATDCGYQIFPEEPKRVRFPDGSFIAAGRLPDGAVPDGHLQIPPDLAIEVVSPNDTAEEVEAKRLAFLRAGAAMIWIIYPGSRTVHVFRQGGAAAALGEADQLTCEDVLPGFACKVAEFFEGL